MGGVGGWGVGEGVDIPMHTMKLSYGDVDYFSY